MDEKNPHTDALNYLQVSYWKGNSACGRDDNPTRATLRPARGQWPSLDFELPRQQWELDKVKQLMQSAYQRGEIDNRAAIGKMFKELIAV